MKVRFIEPAERPYRPSLLNNLVYNRYIRTPSQGVMTLATIANKTVEDVLAYSESISEVDWEDVLTADVICISIFTFNAERGYRIADLLRSNGDALVIIGGLHATLVPEETALHADLVMLGEGDETMPFVLNEIREGRMSPESIKDHVEGTSLAAREGFAWMDAEGRFRSTGTATPPLQIDTVPNRHLLYRFKEMTSYNTIWPQVHASRGCPHSCDYCGLVAAFGSTVRTRSPEAVIEDIMQAIDFFDTGNHRLAKMLWITDDNFFANRKWALSVLRLIVDRGIEYNFTVQARSEVGFDDEMLEALKRAGFSELAMGIEFIEDEAFKINHKASSVAQIKASIRNIQAHGLRVRGLFILGADNHTPGISERLVRFVKENGISGVLLQAMYFIPGTRSYEEHRSELIPKSPWSRCVGRAVHHPKHMSARQLQQEVINASKAIYAPKELLAALVTKRGIERLLLIGEFFWQASERYDMEREMRAVPSILDNAPSQAALLD